MKNISAYITGILSNRVYFLLVLLAIVFVVMSLLSPYFLNIGTIFEITRLGTVLSLLALGQTLVILAGGAGIDLSVGAALSLSGVFLGLMVHAGINIWFASLLTILAGGLLGAVNGITVAWWGVPPLIGTLATMWVYAALALVITGGIPVSGFPASFEFLGAGNLLGIPASILLVAVPVFLILHYVLGKTYIGRWIYLIGVNDTAARFSGVPITLVRFGVYTLSGIMAGIGAVMMSSWLMTARPDVGSGLELQSITVAVLGGTNIFGGAGSLLGTVLAVLIVTLVASGLQLGGINAIWQLAVLGIILLAAVALNHYINRVSARRMGVSL